MDIIIFLTTVYIKFWGPNHISLYISKITRIEFGPPQSFLVDFFDELGHCEYNPSNETPPSYSGVGGQKHSGHSPKIVEFSSKCLDARR